MSDFPVPIAKSQLDQFKKQANILGEEIHTIIGGKVLRGNRALNLYAAACDYASYNAVTIASKGIVLSLDDDNLFILTDERLPTMAKNITKYSLNINDIQAFQALINLRNKTSLGHLVLCEARKALAPALSSIKSTIISFDQDKMSKGESFAERRRGEEFKDVYAQVDNIIRNEIKPDPREQLDLQKLANNIYAKLNSTKGFSSLDLAGLIVDFSRKLGVSVYFKEESEQPNLFQSGHYHFDGPVSKMQFESKAGKAFAFEPARGNIGIDNIVMPASGSFRTLSNDSIKSNITGDMPSPPMIIDIGKSHIDRVKANIEYVSKSAMEKEKFLEQLSDEMDQQVLENFRKQLPKLNKRTPEQWCLDMAFEFGVPQRLAAKFLKDERRITVDLLPEPDF